MAPGPQACLLVPPGPCMASCKCSNVSTSLPLGHHCRNHCTPPESPLASFGTAGSLLNALP
eukprot:2621564-Prorocentrum_lima.AAC.1